MRNCNRASKIQNKILIINCVTSIFKQNNYNEKQEFKEHQRNQKANFTITQ